MFDRLSERFTRIFERPTPLISCGTDAIETSSPPGFLDGYFIVKNAGGGNLEGDIFAQSSFINLLTQTVEGNDVIIEYEMNLSHLDPGDVFTSQIVLTTSGGQLVIPVKILIEPHFIKCGRYKIHSLEDFSDCVRLIPEEAAGMFVSAEFEQWLVKSKCAHMEFYRKMCEDEVGVKEMDSFLTACGLKEKAVMRAERKSILVAVLPEGSAVTEHIPLKRVSWGFFEYKVRTKGRSPWLMISNKTVSNIDFVSSELAYPVKIEPRLLTSGKSFETVIFENSQETIEVNITVERPKLFTVRTSRLSYKNEDSGYLVCYNYTGRNAVVEIKTSENFVRFKAAKYVVERVSEIPFEIKVNSFLNLGIGKKPINICDVYLRAVIDGKVYKDILTIKAGSLLDRIE